MNYLLTAFIAIVVTVGSFFSVLHTQPQGLTPQMQTQMQKYLQESQSHLVGDTLPFAGQTYNLAGSGVSSSAASITLTSLTIKQTGQKIRTVDLVGSSGTFYVTIEPGSNTKQEIIGCTGVTQNTSSATLTGCSRGLSPVTPYTASTTLQFVHAGGSQVVFSDPPQLFNQYAALANANTFTGVQTFSTSPLLTTDCTGLSGNTAICAKAYIDGVAVAGASNANQTTKGIVQIPTGTQMASGTILGSTGAWLAVPSFLASSTASTTQSIVPVTRMPRGVLDSTFIATSSLDVPFGYLFTASTTYTGTTTINSTTTIKANDVNGAPLKLNGLAYAFPASQSASAMLQTNGSGVLSWVTSFVNKFSASLSGVSTNQTSSTTVLALSIPGGTLSTTNILRCDTFGGTQGINIQSAATLWLDVSYGGTSSSTLAMTQSSGGAQSASASILIGANSTTNSQVQSVNIVGSYMNNTGKTLSIDSTVTQILYIVAKASGANTYFAPDQIICTLVR